MRGTVRTTVVRPGAVPAVTSARSRAAAEGRRTGRRRRRSLLRRTPEVQTLLGTPSEKKVPLINDDDTQFACTKGTPPSGRSPERPLRFVPTTGRSVLQSPGNSPQWTTLPVNSETPDPWGVRLLHYSHRFINWTKTSTLAICVENYQTPPKKTTSIKVKLDRSRSM